MEIREIVRQWRVGESIQAIARNTGVHRTTIRRNQGWAERGGLLRGEAFPARQREELASEAFKPNLPPQQVSSVAPYQALVEAMLKEALDGAVIWRRLQERGNGGSLSSI